MTDILPPAGWPNVRQLETNEFALGGANGNMNEQAKSLAARSELLKQYAALPYESKTGGYALNERVQLATGDIVRSTIASNVNNPNVNMTGWEVPSLNPAKNLSDVPNKATARSNLSVYSQAEVNTAIANATPTIPDATETVAGKAEIATQTETNAAADDTRFVTPKKLFAGLRSYFNVTGTAPMFACRAWVSFDSTTTPITIRASGNVSSVILNATGDYTINFTSPMPTPFYAVFGLGTDGISGTGAVKILTSSNSTASPLLKTVNAVRVGVGSTVAFNSKELTIGVFC